jgi:hypothetical protein
MRTSTRLPSPQGTRASNSHGHSSSSGTGNAQELHHSTSSSRRGSGRSGRSGFSGASAQQNPAQGGRSNKPPPLSLFNTSASSPANSPHALAAAAAARSGRTGAAMVCFMPLSCGGVDCPTALSLML